MKKIIYCVLLFLFSCNNSQQSIDNASYFDGKELWEKKCSSCHSFLMVDGLNQTSLSQMRELKFDSLYLKVKRIKNDTNHIKSPLNINNVNDSDLRRIAFYIKKTGDPKP